MSIIADLIEAEKLAKARMQPNLSFLQFSASEWLVEIRERLFPDIDHTAHIYFVTKGPLACISHTSESALIYIHQLLNHSDTPIEVIKLIVKHELLHLRIRPALVEGKELQHPPQFWEAERAICPERKAAWSWIWSNLWPCLKRRPRLERIDVTRNWKQVWARPKTSIATCEVSVTDEEIEEGGW